MKRVFEHPPKIATGKKYWRSLEELSDTPDFRQWLEQEFPQGIAELDKDGLSRRNFLQLMGASMALAGFGLGGCRRPEAHIVPFTKSPEWMIPGKNLHYATAMPRRNGALPLLATTFNGRPTHIEGNPLHPESGGKSDTFAQASVLDLYDPDRSKNILKPGKAKATREELFAELDHVRQEAAQNQGAGLAFLVEETLSPTRERLRKQLTAQFPKLTWCVYEPLSPGNGIEAVSLAFGGNYQAQPQLEKARVILALDCDFLGCDSSSLKVIRDFTNGRRVHKPTDKMNRLYVAETRYTVTGGMADHRHRLPASQMGAFLVAIARELITQGRDDGLAGVIQGLDSIQLNDVDPVWIQEVVRDLIENAGKSLVLVGEQQPVPVQLLALAINQVLGNVGSTLLIKERQMEPVLRLNALAEKIQNKQISTLIVIGGNPVYNAPVDLNWAALQKSVPNVIRVGFYEDETSAMSHWHVPGTHYLEMWSDTLAADGTYLTLQPLVLPLYEGISDLQILAKLNGLSFIEGPELIRETFETQLTFGLDNFDRDAAWKKCVHDGFLAGSEARTVSPAFNFFTVSDHSITPSERVENRFEVSFVGDYSVDDGRYINNGWMQEFPDPITKLTWSNAALLSPNTARELGVVNETIKGVIVVDMIQITLNGRKVEAPALIAPGCSPRSIILPLGYGRTRTGKVGSDRGFDAYALRTSSASFFAGGVEVRKLDRKQELAITQEHQSMEGRALVREAPLEHFQKEPNFTDKMGVDAHAPRGSFYKNPPLQATHQWGMSIDLTTCTGCNACMIACQSENNIPIVGPDQVKKGREMHWIRVDRYFVTDEEVDQDKNEYAEDPQMLMQPIPCMHCENAPCETVCPVNATIHSEEGLNVMTYNRCIGTRYCANNCPYKVRRFNYFDYNQRPVLEKSGGFLGKFFGTEADGLYKGPLTEKGSPETLKMQKNPNVTVRMRGVIEKCTYCVQRLESAKIEWKVKNGTSPDVMIPTDSVQTACQQACPADAIVFGNLNDPKSRVTQLKKLSHDYGLLEYLETRPRTTYLGRIRNPNKRMPGAELVGMSTLADPHQYHGAHHEHHEEEDLSHSPSHLEESEGH